MPVQAILHDIDLKITRYEPITGGDISTAYCLYSAEKKYFLKLNAAARYPAMFEKEAGGLQALQKAAGRHKPGGLFIPAVYKYGETNDHQYLVLEWMEQGSPGNDFWEQFGRSLAGLHQHSSDFFGWHEDNYIGSLAQHNSKHHSWASFYSECRIMPLVKNLCSSGAFSTHDVKDAISLCDHLTEVFPQRPPAMLHGDLWSGNFMATRHGRAAVFDPAVYFGHHEIDIGMTKMFGGFNDRFYAAYAEIFPLEKNWEQRLQITQLYPLLVHAVLFGGHYIGAVRNIIRRF